MKILFLSVLLLGCFCVNAQKKYVGPPNNVGREYGNPKMPLVVSHLAGANKERLKRLGKNSQHWFLSKVLCFRKLCRIQSGHTASLRAISFKKFKKKIEKNAKKGVYKIPSTDTTNNRKPIAPPATPVVDTVKAVAATAPVVKTDSLIVLGAELLFETNKSNLKSEHFAVLNSIVDYLLLHPQRSVKISGHTDDVGSEDHNVALSKKRADVVAEYLVGNGVDINRVETFGFGNTKPLVANTTEEGRKKNRRVELLIHDGK
ncbi:MAG TPA: OmpA family protein [Cyclobacteriaceae bacterium]|nr:OmpA family protein [Cyclobacteriaceae bacterium]